MMATNKVPRSEEAFADTQVYQKRWKKKCDHSSCDCLNDYLVKLLRNVGSVSFGVIGIEIAIADLEG